MEKYWLGKLLLSDSQTLKPWYLLLCYMFHDPCVLTCLGCCDKIPQTGKLEQQKFISQFWSLEVQDHPTSEVGFILRLVRQHLLQKIVPKLPIVPKWRFGDPFAQYFSLCYPFQNTIIVQWNYIVITDNHPGNSLEFFPNL